MRTLAVAICTVVAAVPAAADSIYPPGGAVPDSPTLWITASRMPRIEVSDERGPVSFEIDELQMERGPRRIALRPQVGNGPFTVRLDDRAVHFTADSTQRHHGAMQSDIERVSIERIGGRDTLVFELEVEPRTVMYLINHDSPRAIVGDRFGRYVWVGPGSPVARAPGWQRFELPLSEVGLGCTRGGGVELVPYTTQIDGATNVHSITTLDISEGRASFERLDSMLDTYQPCVGASFEPRARQQMLDQLATDRATPAVAPRPIFSSLDAAFPDNPFDGLEDLYVGLLQPEPVVERPSSPPSRPAPELPWRALVAVLLALALVPASSRLATRGW